MGEVIRGADISGLALNGRSYTDLLALQPGIVPVSTQTADSIVMAGASVAIVPSGGLNPGFQSIAGQREDANAFVVNGGDVKELMNGGTSIVPNLDSLAEFRVLTNNMDAEYGNHSGGVVDVVTKSGTNEFHGTAFEFLRNTDLDARNFFSNQRSFYRQNQFGATIGGPLRKNRFFYFLDYQGTRTAQGIDTGLIAVPTNSERNGDFGSQLSGAVSGPYLANLLSQRLGYQVASGEPYYVANCQSVAQCVFPSGIIPSRAWSAPARQLLSYIPAANSGTAAFTDSATAQRLGDDKGSARIDANTERWGVLSAYYFLDDYRLNNPYPTGQGGSNVPGFNALNLGRSQLASIGQTKSFGAYSVNELRLHVMRTSNVVGQPQGGVGPSLASQGFQTGIGTAGIVALAPSIEGIENVIFDSFVIGTPITNLAQANNTFGAADNFSRVLGAHTLKAGIQVSFEQVNVNPNATFNGSFLFSSSTETGVDFANFLIGVATNYNQADSRSYYPRHKYAGGFVQDSWRARSNLTFNYGLRWDLMEYWFEKYNQVPTFVLGEQSQVFPNAPPGIVYPSDPGIPRTLVPSRNRFAPRFGIAWSPQNRSALLRPLLGGPGRTSIRAGFGLFYSGIQGNTLAFDEPQPPYGLSYTSPAPPLFDSPFRSAATGEFAGNPFPLTFPSLRTSRTHPDTGVDFSPFEPITGATGPSPNNTYPYSESYFFSIERELKADTLFTVTYTGSESHHLLLVYSLNPGNPALCVSLAPSCVPFGESTTYLNSTGNAISGTRGPFGSAYGNDDFEGSFGNSNYNSLQVTLRHSSKNLSLLLGYTFSKSIDEASSLSDPVNPFNFKLTRALSAFDVKHNFEASYNYALPLQRLFRRSNRFSLGWSISGITRISSGLPVTLKSTGDNSLTGSIPNGVNNYSLDLPDYNGAPLDLHSRPGSATYFNASAFTVNALGTPGTASRRSFYGPGMLNTDLALLKTIPITETKALQLRFESFNTFNRAQFFGPDTVNGNIDSASFGRLVKAMPPRLMQLAIKLSF
jgi:hypothetical protein